MPESKRREELAPLLYLCNKVSILLETWGNYPSGKPGKSHSLPASYRPATLVSNLCKIIERMVIFRLSYAMDSVLCLKSDTK